MNKLLWDGFYTLKFNHPNRLFSCWGFNSLELLPAMWKKKGMKGIGRIHMNGCLECCLFSSLLEIKTQHSIITSYIDSGIVQVMSADPFFHKAVLKKSCFRIKSFVLLNCSFFPEFCVNSVLSCMVVLYSKCLHFSNYLQSRTFLFWWSDTEVRCKIFCA